MLQLDYAKIDVLLRQIVNGAMTLSALLVVTIFARWLFLNRRYWLRRDMVSAAFAITILMIGHLFRSASSWVEFVLLEKHWSDPQLWLRWTWMWFIASAVLVVIGKSIMLWTFAPLRWRWILLGVGIPLCLLIPTAVALFL